MVTVVVWISITVASIMNIEEGGQITNPRSRRVSWLQAAPEQTAIPAREGDGVEIEAKVNHSYPSLEAPSQFFRRAAWDAAAVTTEVGDARSCADVGLGGDKNERPLKQPRGKVRGSLLAIAYQNLICMPFAIEKVMAMVESHSREQLSNQHAPTVEGEVQEGDPGSSLVIYRAEEPKCAIRSRSLWVPPASR